MFQKTYVSFSLPYHRQSTAIHLFISKIIIECILSLGIFLISTVLNAPPLAEISWASEMKKRSATLDVITPLRSPLLYLFHRNIDEMDSRLSFASFNHRGTKYFGSS